MTGQRDIVVITRPVDAAGATAEKLQALGWAPLIAPLLRIEPRRTAIDPDIQAVLVTSMNGLPGLPASLHDKPLLAVGDATAARARQMGFRHAVSAQGDSADLIALAQRDLSLHGKPLLLACGARQGFGLAASLRHLGFTVLRAVLYTVVPAAETPAALADALIDGSIQAVLFYSAETAKTFVALAAGEDLPALPLAIAISRRAAAALAPLPWRDIAVAAAPTEAAMLDLLPGRDHRRE